MTTVKRRGKRMHAKTALAAPTRYWATIRDQDGVPMPCLWGIHREDAEQGCDPDERVVEVEVRIVREVMT